MKYFLSSILTLSLFIKPALAQIAPIDISEKQVKMTYMSSEGETWIDCTAKKKDQPNLWKATCGDYEFQMHLLLKQYPSTNETTIEFHYWVDETAKIKETHTQSTYLTLDSATSAKSVVGYLGFLNDSMQLRLQVNLKN